MWREVGDANLPGVADLLTPRRAAVNAEILVMSEKGVTSEMESVGRCGELRWGEVGKRPDLPGCGAAYAAAGRVPGRRCRTVAPPAPVSPSRSPCDGSGAKEREREQAQTRDSGGTVAARGTKPRGPRIDGRSGATARRGDDRLASAGSGSSDDDCVRYERINRGQNFAPTDAEGRRSSGSAALGATMKR
ncbi:hypothetical protein TTY48_02730 [Tsukamurella sp. TY48]|nr:hypothetical protein TTY48_02730 [Tsukamurella sp. TY48]